MGDGAGNEGSKPVPFSSRALILGVSGGAGGHVSLISSVVRVWGLTGSPGVVLCREDVVKMASRSVLPLINLGGVVEAGPVGLEQQQQQQQQNEREKRGNSLR